MHYASNSPIFLSFTRFSSLIQLARINHSIGHLPLQRRHECHPGSTAHSPLLSASVSAIFSARWTERLIADWPIVRITPTQR
jgi:hypothetical protein